MKLSTILLTLFGKSNKIKDTITEILEVFHSPFKHYSGYCRTYGKIIDGESIPLFKDERKVEQFPLDKLKDLSVPLARFIGHEIALDRALAEFSAPVKLEVDGICLGEFTLLQLRSIYKTLYDQHLDTLYNNLPVRLFPDTMWSPGYTEGVSEMKNSQKVLPFGAGADLPIPNITLLPEREDSKLSEAKLIDYQIYSSALPAEYKAQILERRKRIINAIESLLDSVEFNLTTEEMSSQKTLNYIHFGDPKGMEYYPY